MHIVYLSTSLKEKALFITIIIRQQKRPKIFKEIKLCLESKKKQPE